MDKTITMKFEGIEYIWNNRKWTSKSNLLLGTAFTQKLSELAVKLGLLSRDDFNLPTSPLFTPDQFVKIKTKPIK